MKKTNWSDDNIKALFHEMKEKELEQTPSFEETWAAAEVKMLKKKKTRMWFRVAASIALLVAIGTSLYILHQAPQDNQRLIEIPDFNEGITVWKSPTANMFPTYHDIAWYDISLQVKSDNEGLANISLAQWKSSTDFLLNTHTETENESLTH